MNNKITEITRKKIADHIELSGIFIGGDLNYADFLNRIFDLEALPSFDKRCSNAFSDIHGHSSWGDYTEITWMFYDSRFNLLKCTDNIFVQFIEESLHPLVCKLDEDRLKLKAVYDKLLPNDKFELYVSETISSMDIYSVREIILGQDITIKKHDIIKMFNSEYVTAKIKVMEDNIVTNPDLSLGTAKELIETCCKSILKSKGIIADKNWELQKLFKETINVLSFIELGKVEKPELAEKSIKQVLGGCNSIIQGVAELRNAYGTGHGKDKDFSHLPIVYVKFIVATISDILLFILQINGETTEIYK